MFYELKYINEDGQSVKFEATTQRFVDTTEVAKPEYKELALVRFEGFGEVEADIHSTKSPNQDGSTMTNQTLKERYPHLEFVIRASDFSLLSEERRRLSSLFSPNSKGKFELTYGGKIYALDVVPENVPSYGAEDSVGRTQTVMVDFVAHDPYWKNAHETKEEIAIWQPAFSFPLEIDDAGIEMGRRKPSLIARIENEGDTDAGLKIVFKAGATVENPSLFNVDTREYFKVEKTLEAGEQVIVTTGFQDKRVQLVQGGITSVLHEWDYTSTFLQLNRGMNLFRYDADAGLDNLSVDIYYTQKYVGV